MPILLPQDRNIKLPDMMKVKQTFAGTDLEDPAVIITELMDDNKIKGMIFPGQKIAVAVGSRTIDKIDVIVGAVIDVLKSMGAQPFIVTAMGSHGGGTPEGCIKILEDMGITEEAIGAPLKADMDVVKLGQIAGEIDVYTDKNSYEADMTILINRIKPHTEFNGKYESGICKLATIGLGRHTGCTSLHEAGTENFTHIIPDAAALVFEKSNIGFAVGIVENAYDKVSHIEIMTKDEIMVREPELLEMAKKNMASIGIPEIDILIVEELGKDISGIGMDPNVIGRFGPKAGAPGIPDIGKIIVLRLSENTHGNACGIGIADLTTRHVYENIDFESTYANCIACGCDYETEYIPLVMTDEEEAVAAAVKMLKIKEPEKSRIVKIKNTLSLSTLEISETLREYIEARPDRFEIIGQDDWR